MAPPSLAVLGLDPDHPNLVLGSGAASRLRVVPGGTKAPAGPNASNRRRSRRVPPQETQWADLARLRGGLDVRVIDIGERGVLIETTARLHIGVRLEVALFANNDQARVDLSGTVRRCHVASLDPLTYRGALEFDRSIQLDQLEPFVAREAASA